MLLNEKEFKEISNGLYELSNLNALKINLERFSTLRINKIF